MKLVRLASQFRCPICDRDALPFARRKASQPLRIRAFNVCVILDFADVHLQRLGEAEWKFLILIAIDAFSSLVQAWIVPNGSSTAAITVFSRGWIQPYGPPSRVYHDNALALVSTEWAEWCSRNRILIITTSAAEAPWQHVPSF